MSKPRFFQAVLQEVKTDIIEHVYPKLKGQMTLEERLPKGECTDCGCNSWIILPKESITVKESGKPYIECMNCGMITHL